MSDDKPDKLFFDEKTGIVHGSECPKTKKEFGEGGNGECAIEKLVRDLRASSVHVAGHKCGSAPSGPAKYSSDRYREGHDRIFGTKPPVGQA